MTKKRSNISPECRHAAVPDVGEKAIYNFIQKNSTQPMPNEWGTFKTYKDY
jgi:hypothetical protein